MKILNVIGLFGLFFLSHLSGQIVSYLVILSLSVLFEAVNKASFKRRATAVSN